MMLNLILLTQSCIAILCVSAENFYIPSSSDSQQCNYSNCLTLTQFASNYSYLHPDTMLSLQAGNHSLSRRLYIGRIVKLFVIRADTTVSPHNVSTNILCEHSRMYFKSRTLVVHIQGITFIGCTLVFENASTSIETSCFTDSTDGVSRLYYMYTYLGQFSPTFARAGAVEIIGSKLSISNSVFYGNQAEIGGALFAMHSTVRISNSSFVENRVSRNDSIILCLGGAIYAYNSTVMVNFSTFLNNSANRVTKSHGGVFALFASTLMLLSSKFSYNVAEWGCGGVIYSHRTDIVLTGNTFLWNYVLLRGGVMRLVGGSLNDSDSHFISNSAGHEGGVAHMEESVVELYGSSMHSNVGGTQGGGVSAHGGTLDIMNCELSNNSALNDGGAIYVKKAELSVKNSSFSNNAARRFYGGAIHALHAASVNIWECSFEMNIADRGGAIYTLAEVSTINMNMCDFSTNTAISVGGVMFFFRTKIVNVNNSTFFNSTAKKGGVIGLQASDMKVSLSTFVQNYAYEGGVVYAIKDTVMQMHDMTVSSNSARLGLMYFVESSGNISGNTTITENIGSLFVYNSKIEIAGSTNFTHCSSPKKSHKSIQEGGVITAFQSEVTCSGTCTMMLNFAEVGGAIHATESEIYITGKTVVMNNTAEQTGGGIYLYKSEIHCRGRSILTLLRNQASEKGGAVHAISSSLKVDFVLRFFTRSSSLINFVENQAKEGGGIFLDANTKLYILLTVGTPQSRVTGDPNEPSFTFTNNTADFGGAIFVADETNTGICASSSYRLQSSNTECFLQSLSLFGDRTLNRNEVTFSGNFANKSGSSLFGGLLDRCTISSFAPVYTFQRRGDGSSGTFNNAISAREYFDQYTNINLNDSVSSQAVRVCFCRSDVIDCDYSHHIKVKKGRRFELTVAAVDQVGNPLSNVSILSALSWNLGGLGENQSNQTTGDSCTELRFNVFSPHRRELLKLYADGPCKGAKLSRKIVPILFSKCTCQVGFQNKSLEPTNCVCECDPRITKYVSECDDKTGTVRRKGNPWLSYVSDPDNTSTDYLIYPHCPMGYCHPPGSIININLSQPNGADVQCLYNRSGLLCGTCKPGYSLSLGTAHCIVCPTYWPALFVVQVIAAFILGIVLVAVLLILNLTVAVGTLNGIIFYANVIHTYGSTFTPHPKPTFTTVFISWLNLEIGFDSCFFEGLDDYSKTWIQFMFPLYVIFLVFMVILISGRSKRFSQLIGKKNPVATLATLILLSYAGFLSNIIRIFSSGKLNYPGPNGPVPKVVWLPDATVVFFTGKHIPLTVVAVFLLLLCVAYTGLLFFWQWIVRFDDRCLLKWIKSQKLSHFVEAYHAPYSPRNRYWTGLLLIVRIILLIASAMNTSDNPNINVLVIGLIMVAILGLIAVNARVYKKWPLDIIEVFIYISIIILCISTMYTNIQENENAKLAVADTSVSIVFVLFLAIICFHIYTEFVAKFWLSRKLRSRAMSNDASEIPAGLASTTVTTSVIERPERPALQLGNVSDVGTYHELRETLLEH